MSLRSMEQFISIAENLNQKIVFDIDRQVKYCLNVDSIESSPPRGDNVDENDIFYEPGVKTQAKHKTIWTGRGLNSEFVVLEAISPQEDELLAALVDLSLGIRVTPGYGGFMESPPNYRFRLKDLYFVICTIKKINGWTRPGEMAFTSLEDYKKKELGLVLEDWVGDCEIRRGMAKILEEKE